MPSGGLNKKTDKQRVAFFLSKVSKQKGFGPNSDCWIWQGSLDPKDGYGRYMPNTLLFGEKLAHRIMFKLKHPKSQIKGWCICHRCDNPLCVKPSHLYRGTPKTNATDRKVRERGAARAFNGNAKLSSAQVLKIRSLYSLGYLQREIGVLFGIDQTHISRIVRRKNWT